MCASTCCTAVHCLLHHAYIHSFIHSFHSFIHRPPWIVSRGRYAWWRVCCGACGDTLFFRAWRDCASESLGGATPEPFGSTRTHRRSAPHTHTPHSLCCPSSTNLSREERYQGSWGSTAQRSLCVSPSPWQPPGSGAAKSRKTQGQSGSRNLHAANVRHPERQCPPE